MSSLKPIKLYSHASGPNPWKVVIILEELGVPYEAEYVDFSTIHEKPYTDVNPNGRVPAIVDPNNDNFTLWESGAINTYLVDTYDKEHRLTYTSSPEKYQVLQWIMFQMSGQGPYYGQAAWFMMFHPEKLPSAQERYLKEIERVIGVIDSHLGSKPSGQQLSLVGDKVTYADLSFVTWAALGQHFLSDKYEKLMGDRPHYKKWLEGLMERPAVKKAMADKAEAGKKGH